MTAAALDVVWWCLTCDGHGGWRDPSERADATCGACGGTGVDPCSPRLPDDAEVDAHRG